MSSSRVVAVMHGADPATSALLAMYSKPFDFGLPPNKTAAPLAARTPPSKDACDSLGGPFSEAFPCVASFLADVPRRSYRLKFLWEG